MFKVGDAVIFQISKVSADPGPRARDVHPSEFGETYRYLVDKHWRVAEVFADGSLALVTRRGKRHIIEANDPRLRHARWWERWLFRRRFPDLARLASIPEVSPIPKRPHK